MEFYLHIPPLTFVTHVSLVLISTLPHVEAFFHGIDRAAIGHRRTAIAGLVLLAPHIALSTNPGRAGLGGQLGALGVIGLVALAAWAVLPRWRTMLPRALHLPVDVVGSTPVARRVMRALGGYERWRTLHRTTGLFVAAGFAHGAMNGTPFPAEPVLRWSYLAIGSVGLAFYLYRELLARFFWPMHDYQVRGLHVVGEGLVEVTLAPVGRPLRFVPGQFAMVFLEARDGWHRHPFTIASGAAEADLRVTIKALGDYTSRLEDLVAPGMPAVIGGPHGRFDRCRGTSRQIWIAAGVGIAPFLSWLRSLDSRPRADVDLFYTSAGPAPFADEILAIAALHSSLTVHLIDSNLTGRLTPHQVLTSVHADTSGLSVFMCGPEPMLRLFQTGLRSAGVRRRHIHREYFDWR
jgi:predicted ferric reductase